MVKLLPVELISDGKIEPKLLLAKEKATPPSGVPCARVFSSSRPSSLCGGSTWPLHVLHAKEKMLLVEKLAEIWRQFAKKRRKGDKYLLVFGSEVRCVELRRTPHADNDDPRETWSKEKKRVVGQLWLYEWP
jgi:hypothetical protein